MGLDKQKTDWYHWGRWVTNMLYMSMWMPCDTQANRLFGNELVTKVQSLDGHYFFDKEELAHLNTVIADRIDNDNEWFTTYFSLSDALAEKVLVYEHERDFENFLRDAVECLSTSKIVELLDLATQEYIQHTLHKSPVELLSAMKPYKQTHLKRYEEELRTLDLNSVDKFVTEHQWIGTHGFWGEPLTKEKVLADYYSLQTLEHPEITFDPQYTQIVELGSKLAYYRSYLVETVDRVAFSYWGALADLARKQAISFEDILLCTFEEIIDLLNKKDLPQDYKKRADGFGLRTINDTTTLIIGDELHKALTESLEEVETEGITEIKGMTANKGLVIGVVKILESPKDIPKLQPGEILVAHETTPDLVMAMKISGAIVTNQGGITSHAAIVSRELGKPCIIGTKIATKVLKDGDLIEVNADEGIVKIL